MGKYMRKARAGRAVIEVMTQGPLGVRTRARAQAMQEKLTTSNSGNAKKSASASMQSFIPAQISYLELRSRRLEKVVGCISNRLPASRKSTSAGECRRLSDLTNSGILTDNSPSRMALSIDEAQHARRQTSHHKFNENQEFVYHFHEDKNEAEEESSLQGFVQRSLQHWTSGGCAPPSVAHSRSNSRSNSVTRELPPPTPELPPHGVLTRNRRKLEMQTSDVNARSTKAVAMEVDIDASCIVKPNGLAKILDVGVSFGENPMEGVWSGGNRLAHEGTPSVNSKDGSTPPFAADTKLLPELQSTIHQEQTSLASMHSSLDREIEDFFLQAEQQVQRRFMERYNFDPQKESPLPGRYDWVEM